MNDTTLNAYALEIGLGKTTQQMTNQEKVALALEMFLDRTSDAAGNYAEENDTLAGSLTTAKAALSNFIAGTGNIDDVVDSLSNASEVILENFGELLPNLVEGLGEIADELIPIIPEILRELIPSVLSVIDELIDTLIDVAPEIVVALADGIEEALPILSPLTSLIRLLAENFDILTVSVIAGFAAFKGVAVVNSAVKAYQSAKIVLAEYTLAVNANTAAQATGATTQTLLLSLMKPLEIAIGVLTGKIKLQEAATLALKAAKDLLSGGLTILITVIVAATAALVKYIATNKSAADEIREAHEEAIAAIDETLEESTTAAKAEVATAEKLADELIDLEKQIKSGTLSEKEATKAKQDFAACANKLNDIIPNSIDFLYDETGEINIQKNAVYSLVKAYGALLVAKAKVTAYEQKMTEIQKSIIDTETAIEEYEESGNDKAVGVKGFVGRGYNPEYVKLTDSLSDYKTQLADLTEKALGAMKDVHALEQQIGDSAKNTGESVRNVADSVTDSIKKGAGEQAEAVKEAYEKEAEALELYHKYGLITDKEYYEGLFNIRDKYFVEGSKLWEEYNDKIAEGGEKVLEYALDNIETQKNALLKSIEDLDKAQEKMADKLQPEQLYTTNTVLEKGKVVNEFFGLADISQENKELKHYNELLDELFKKRGELPEEIMNQLYGMNAEEGIKYVQALLSAGDAEFEKYINDILENRELTAETAEKLYSSQREELEKEFEAVFGDLPDDFFGLGESSAEKFGEGFENVIRATFNKLKAELMAEMEELKSSASSIVVSGGGGGNTTNNTYGNTYIMQASEGESTQQQLADIKAEEDRKEMSGGY